MKNIVFRGIIFFIVIFPLFHIDEFYQHFYAHFTGNFINHLIINNRKIVLINILIFCAFLIPLSYRKKADWKEYGLVSAFFVSLFIEMYGIPFTMLFASHYFNQGVSNLPPSVIEFNLFGTGFSMTMAMAYGAVLMLFGFFLIMYGWITLYINVQKDKFVDSGIYSISRHPQYVGFIMIILGWFIGWPTILTLIFSPILVYKYITVCRKEEKEMININPGYKKYMEKVPFMI